MLPKVLAAYKKHGYRVDPGSPERLYSTIVDESRRRTVNCSGGFTVSDAFLFTAIAGLFQPENILVIGNSFGLSTFVLAELFPSAHIDAIDAELENVEPQLGSQITRKLASSDFPNVHLTVGFSPQDLPGVAAGKQYQFIFVDAMHTNEAVLNDYRGLRELTAVNCFIYFHDVANCNMLESWSIIKREAEIQGFSAFELGFTQMGCTAIVRELPQLNHYLTNLANSFSGPYLNGYTSENIPMKSSRPFFWDLSFGQIETQARKRLRKLFK